MLFTVAKCLKVVLSVCVFMTARAHVFKVGSCPNVEVVGDFNFDKFQGRWYAIEKSQTSSSCMSYNFTKNADGSREVQEKYRLFGIRIFDWNDVSQTGTLTTDNGDSDAKMMVQFPFSLSPFAPVSLWVMKTDYDSYAAIWSCRPFLFGNFQSGMILSRNRTLNRATINKLRESFEENGIDKHDLSVINHSDCSVDQVPTITDQDFKVFGNVGPINPTAAEVMTEFTRSSDVTKVTISVVEQSTYELVTTTASVTVATVENVTSTEIPSPEDNML